MATFTIKGRLPSANELVRWDRIVGRRGRGRFFGSIKRRQAILHVYGFIMEARLKHYQNPVDISIRWVEPNARRDYDNIASGVKFILDALVKSYTICGDSRKWIPRPVRHDYAVDKVDPRIEVTINDWEDVPGPELQRAT